MFLLLLLLLLLLPNLLMMLLLLLITAIQVFSASTVTRCTRKRNTQTNRNTVTNNSQKVQDLTAQLGEKEKINQIKN